MEKRHLGNTGLQVCPLGLGGWAAGGPVKFRGQVYGYRPAEETEVLQALDAALELGIGVLDTSDVYGAGRGEQLLGKALRKRRDRVVLSSKFGYTCCPHERELLGMTLSKSQVIEACEQSLKRLGTDHLDIYHLQVSPPLDCLPDIMDAMQVLLDRGCIRHVGWATEDALNVQLLGSLPAGKVLQCRLNVLEDQPELIDLAEQAGHGLLAAAPLGMGFLTQKAGSHREVRADDMRAQGTPWAFPYRNGRVVPAQQQKLQAIQDLLTSGGRSLAQGALGWVWARHPHAVPIPGFRTVKQVEELAGALHHGPLSLWTLRAIADLLEPQACAI